MPTISTITRDRLNDFLAQSNNQINVLRQQAEAGNPATLAIVRALELQQQAINGLISALS